MKVGNMEKAWEEANKIFPYDYEKDEEGSLKAGYSIYRSTASEHPQNWISDLGNRLEINLENGSSTNIWIEDQGEDVEVTVIAKTGKPEFTTLMLNTEKIFDSFGLAEKQMNVRMGRKFTLKKSFRLYGW